MWRALNRTARDLVPSVRHCGKTLQSTVTVHLTTGAKTPCAGLSQCKNRWFCTYCSPVWRSLQARISATKIERALADDGYAWLVVLTISHRPEQSLEEVLTSLQLAWTRTYRRNRHLRHIGWEKWLDVVLDGDSGPHPHYNVLVVSPDPTAAHTMRTAWLAAARSTGLRASEQHAVHITPLIPQHADSATAYASKAGNACFEAADNFYKRSKAGSLPLQLLKAEHLSPDPQRRAIIANAARELKGRKAVTRNDLWRLLPGPEDIDEDADITDHTDRSDWTPASLNDIAAVPVPKRTDMLSVVIAATDWRSNRIALENLLDRHDATPDTPAFHTALRIAAICDCTYLIPPEP